MNNPNKTLEINSILDKGRLTGLLAGIKKMARQAVPGRRTGVSVGAGVLASWWGLDAYTPAGTLKHELTRCVNDLCFLNVWVGGFGQIPEWIYLSDRQTFHIVWVPAELFSSECVTLPIDWNKMGPTGRDVFHILRAVAADQHSDVLTWQGITDLKETVQIVISVGFLKKVRRRVAWARFKTEIIHWHKNPVCLRLTETELVQVPMIKQIELKNDKEIMVLTVSKRILYALEKMANRLII